MGFFRPTPMKLEYGEPVHQMVARAMLTGAIRISGDIIRYSSYHFVGPHGIEYRKCVDFWRNDSATQVALICEDVQQDFNERIAAMSKAREYARENLAVPQLFTTVRDEDTTT
jgi:hypothetical protein